MDVPGLDVVAVGDGAAPCGVAGAAAEHEALEQGVAAEAVGAVKARAGALAARVEAIERRARVEVYPHPADHVVGRRADGDELLGDVELELGADPRDGGEPRADAGGVEVAQVEEHLGGACGPHLGHDRAGHDVARRQLPVGVVAGHEALALLVDQVGALAAHRLADEPPRRPSDVEGRGVELHELHVLEHRARPVGDGDAVACGHIGVCRLAVDLADAAARQDRLLGPHQRDAVHLAREDGAQALAVVGEQVHDEGVVEALDAGARRHLRHKRLLHLGARGIALGVDDPGTRVAALAGERELPALLVEVGAALDELADPRRPLPHNHLHHLALAKPLANGQRVGDVGLEAVGLRQHHRDAALGILGVALAQLVLAHEQHLAVLRRRQRRAQARHPAADNQHVRKPMRQRTAVEPKQVTAGLDVLSHGASGRSMGKRITSRIEAEFVRSMTRRSMPMPSPPAGGIPCSRART